MIDITKVLNDILKAVLGKDVRQAIHDGVKRSNEIADDCDKRQTNLEKMCIRDSICGGRKKDDRCRQVF